MRIAKIFLAALFVIPGSLLAESIQVRTLFHPTFPLSKNWFMSAWQINNFRSQMPDNYNLFWGAGYRGRPDWWLEVQAQKQWSGIQDQWLLDLRFQKKFGEKALLYIEPSLFLSRRALYKMIVFEYKVDRRLGVGIETENIHRHGRDSIGAGPRLSFGVATASKITLGIAVAYQLRVQESDVFRSYLVIHYRH